jgi:hypothetical protein
MNVARCDTDPVSAIAMPDGFIYIFGGVFHLYKDPNSLGIGERYDIKHGMPCGLQANSMQTPQPPINQSIAIINRSMGSISFGTIIYTVSYLSISFK